MSFKKTFLFFIFIILAYISLIGINCPKKYLKILNQNCQKNILSSSLNIEKIKFIFPNTLQINCDITNTCYSINLQKLKLKIDLLKIIQKNKKLISEFKNPKNLAKYLSKIKIKNFDILIKKSFKERQPKNIEEDTFTFTKIFNEIFGFDKFNIEIKVFRIFNNDIDFFYNKHHKIFYFIKNILVYKNILGKEIIIKDIFVKKKFLNDFLIFEFNIENFFIKTKIYKNKDVFFILSNKIKNKFVKYLNTNLNSLEYKILTSKILSNKIKNIFKNSKLFLLKILSLTKIKQSDYKVLKNILNFYNLNCKISGNILCNFSIFFNLENILKNKNKYSAYGNILANINLKYKNLLIENIKFNANINQKIFAINKGSFKINNADGFFKIISKNIFDLPNTIELNIFNLNIINLLNKNLVKFIEFKNDLKINLSLNNNKKYFGKISLKNNFIKINQKHIKLKNINFEIDNNKIDLQNIPILSINKKNLLFLNSSIDLEKFINLSVFIAKPMQIKNIINFENIKLNLKKIKQNKILKENDFINKIYEYLLNINLDTFFINFGQNFNDKKFILSSKSSFFYKNQKIFFEIKNPKDDILEFDFSKNEKSFYYLKIKILPKYFKIIDFYLFDKKTELYDNKNFIFINAKDFPFYIKNKDFYLSFKLNISKKNPNISAFFKIYNDNINFSGEIKYQDNLLEFNKVLINKTIFYGFYNFNNKNYEFRLNAKDLFLERFFYYFDSLIDNKFLKILKKQKLILNGNFNIKKFFDEYKLNTDFLFTNLHKEKILQIIFDDKTKNIDFFQSNIKKISIILDNPSFNSINFKKDKQKNFLINGTVKNLLYKNFDISCNLKSDINISNINTIFFEAKNIKINNDFFQYFYFYIDFFKNTINLKEFSLENKINGNIKKEKNSLYGKINFFNLDLKNFFNAKEIKNVILNGNFFLSQKTSSINDLEIKTDNFDISLNKNGNLLKFLINGSFYKNIIILKNSKIFLKQDEKINFSANCDLKKSFNIDLFLKNIKSNEINKFIKISDDIFDGEIEKGTLNINLSNLKKIEINQSFDLKNAKILTMNAENIEGKLFFYPKQNKLEIKNITILEQKNNKKIHLFIKENSNIFFDKNDIIINLFIYMKKWNLLGINKGLGNISLFMQINSNNLSGQAEFSNFWISNYIFKNEILKFSLKNNILDVENIKKDCFLGQIIFDNGNININNFLYQNLNENKFLSCNGKIFKNKNIDLDIKTKNFEAEIITKIFYIGFYIYGKTNLDIKISGNLFLDPVISINFSSNNGSFDILNFEKLNGNVVINKNSITIKNIFLSYKNKYTLFSHGYIPYPLLDEEKKFTDKQKMLIKIQSLGANLGILEKLYPDIIIKANGEIKFNFDLTNSLDDMKLAGNISVSKGSIFFKDGLKNIHHINSSINIHDNNLQIKTFDASSGKGKIKVFGNILLKDLKFNYFDLDIKIPSKKGIKLELDSLKIPQQSIVKIFPSISSKINFYGDIKMIGDINKYFLKGKLFVYNTNFTYNNSDSNIDSIIQDSILEGMNFDLNIKTLSNVWFENKFCNLAIEGKANFFGPINNIVVNTNINFLRGEINYMNIYFKIKEGEFSLINNEPFLALKAETTINRYDDTFNRNIEDTIKLNIEKSHINNMKFKFESQNFPATTQEEAMSLAFSGQNSGQTTAEKEENMKQEFFRIIDNTITAPLAKIFLQSTSLVDFVNFNTNIANKTLNKPTDPYILDNNKSSNILSGSSLKLAKYLNSKLFFSYSLSLKENNFSNNTIDNKLILQHEIEAKLKLRKNLYLKGLIELNSVENSRKEKQLSLEYSFPVLFNK